MELLTKYLCKDMTFLRKEMKHVVTTHTHHRLDFLEHLEDETIYSITAYSTLSRSLPKSCRRRGSTLDTLH